MADTRKETLNGAEMLSHSRGEASMGGEHPRVKVAKLMYPLSPNGTQRWAKSLGKK